MEIKEIVSYYVDVNNAILEVSFRSTEDSDEYIRTDEIDLSETSDFAYSLNITKDEFELIEEDEDDIESFYKSDDVEFDDEQILLFLNEYYTVFSDRLPKSEIF